ncbi:MAG: sulfatase [Verrucomicrobiota bacterium JB023]|nr:sulfatase [Verrucomicrobiota bacterium JB023]
MKPLLLLLASASLLMADKKPNIVFFLVDDLGIQDLTIEGSTFYETPRISQLAKESMRFTNGYSTCQVCSPSRASIMTGQYPPRVGITDYIGAPTGLDWKRNDPVMPAEYVRNLPQELTTLPEALKAGGYATWFFGKWHLNALTDKENFPEHHGFDVNVAGHHRGQPPAGFFAPFENPRIPEEPEPGTNLTLWLAEQTSETIKKHQESNAEQPFLAYLSFYTVHSPIQSTKELWSKYRDKAAKNPHEGDRFIIDRTSPVRQVQDHPVYAGMMEILDDAVGNVLDTISELGLENDTIVIFTGDNGGVSAGDGKATACLPFRGGKGRQWEGGIRAPLYFKVPGVTKPGSTTDVPATGTDFFPTLLDLAGLPLLPESHVDGVSLKPLLSGEGSIPERALFWHYPHFGNQGGEPSSIIREGDWKLIQYLEDGRLELYNLAEDIGEQNNLAEEHPDKVKDLVAKLLQFQIDTKAKFPPKDPRFDPERKKEYLHRMHTVHKARLEKQAAAFLEPDYQPNEDWWGSLPKD